MYYKYISYTSYIIYIMYNEQPVTQDSNNNKVWHREVGSHFLFCLHFHVLLFQCSYNDSNGEEWKGLNSNVFLLHDISHLSHDTKDYCNAS